jgi:alpha-glucosidase/alpha-D-xyloside xylohydrolase
VDLSTMPLFVRAGAVLPLDPVKQYSSEQVEGPLTVQVYPGADGACSVYEDDGQTFDYKQGAWTALDIRWADAKRTLTLRVAKGSGPRPPASRRIRARVVDTGTTRDLLFSGAPIEVRL